MIAARDLVIRDVRKANMGAISAIYTHHVSYGLDSWEASVPDITEMRAQRTAIQESGFPYRVGERLGEVLG